MARVSPSLIATLRSLVGDTYVVDSGEALRTLSRDFYWYSPVLRRQLDDKRADVVVAPGSLEELRAVLVACHAATVPIVPRGAGTGNYGQCVPLFGGVVIDLARMDRILEITSEGVVRCEPGARLGVIEPEARRRGWELRCLPSTWVKSSMAGFFCGGSGGIGSITWGGIASPGNVKSVTLMTCEEEPRLVRLEEAQSLKALHTYGTTGIMVEIEMRLAPKVSYDQVILSSSDWGRILEWSDTLARDPSVPKRLVTLFEWPIPSYFKPLKGLREREHASFLLVGDSSTSRVVASAREAGLDVILDTPLGDPPKPPYITDYTWNHTTLWALKTDPALTYLQCGFGPDYRRQFAEIRARWSDEILLHLEWTAAGPTERFTPGGHFAGRNVGVGGIPLVRFHSDERLHAMIEHLRSIGVFIANPHTYKLEEGGRHPNIEDKRALKLQTDPKGLLNPGKMASYPYNPFAVAAA